MACGKDLTESEIVLDIKKITKVKNNESIAKIINCCVMTEIYESVRISEKSFKGRTSV